MAQDAFKRWYADGLQALTSAAGRARDAASTGAGGAAPEVRNLVDDGAEIFAKHADTLAGLLDAAGGSPAERPNPFMDGIQSGSRQMIEAAQDPDVRTASTVAAAQIAIHYFIAAYGTLASNARHLGLDEEARTLKAMADEMKAGDERFTALAETMANRRAASADA